MRRLFLIPALRTEGTAATTPPGRGVMPSRVSRPSAPRCAWLGFWCLILILTWGSQAEAAAANPEGSGERLAQMSLEELGQVKVTSVSKEPEKIRKTPAAIFVITRDDIRRSGATCIPEVLRMAPGVEVARVDSDHWSVGIRGFGGVLSSKLLVLIDGRSVYTPLYAGVYWSVQNVPLEDIDRIEIIRGPGGTIWGANAVNGVINIITLSSKETQGVQMRTGGGSVDNADASVTYGGHTAKGPQGMTYRVYGMGFDDAPELHPNGDNYDYWRTGQAGFRADWTAQRRDAFTLQGDLYDQRAGDLTTVGSFTPPGTVVLQGMGELSGGNVLGRWQRTLSNGDLQLQGYYDHTNHTETQFGESRDTYDLDFIHHLTLLGHQDFIWGLGARVSPGLFKQLTPGLNFTPNYQTDTIYSGFLQDEIPLAQDKVELTFGAKLEHNNYTGFEVQPSGRLLWTPDNHNTFWLSASRAVRTPSRLEESIDLNDFLIPNPLIYLQVEGSRKFYAERMIGLEAGYRATFSSRAFVDLALFRNGYDDLYGYGTASEAVALTPAPAHIVFVAPIANETKGVTDGVEIAPELQATSWWRLRGSYSFLHLNLTSKTPDPNSLQLANLATDQGESPHNQVMLGSMLNLPGGVEFDQDYRYVSSLVAEAIGSYNTGDARLGWHATRQLEFSVDGNNLLQPHHLEFPNGAGYLADIKRSVFANITWTFQSGR